MKVTVIGARGMLGYAVSEYFKSQNFDVQTITREQFDIAKEPMQNLEKLIQKFAPDFIVNCAGVIKPMIAKMSIEDVLRVNTVFPQNLAKLANKHKIKAFHITTDCVYTGHKGAYSEDDIFDATDIYGMSKNGGEPHSIMTLRTSIIGEESGQSRSLLEWARSQAGKDVNGFTNHMWNGLTTLNVAKTIHKILNANAYKPGLFHIHSPNSLNKFEMLEVFNQVYELNLKIKPTEAGEVVDRTMKSNFNYSKEFVTQNIFEQVKEMRTFFNQRA